MNRFRFIAKSIVHGVGELSGMPCRRRRQLTDSLIILTYHSFSDGWSGGLFNSLPIHSFESQLRFLKKKFDIVSLEQGITNVQADEFSDRPFLAVTIDDGFRDNYELAWPLLRKYEIPVTIFLATDFLDNGRPPWPTQLVEILERSECNTISFPLKADLKGCIDRSRIAKLLKHRWMKYPPEQRFELLDELRQHLNVSADTRYPPLTWKNVRLMSKQGAVFGSHTVYHSILPEVDAKTVEMELRDSKDRLEYELDARCSLFAYPDGKHSEGIEKQLAASGFTVAVTQDLGENRLGIPSFRLKRVEIPTHDPLTTFHGRVSLAW